MARPWEKPFEDREEALSALGPLGLMGHVLFGLAIVFAGIGVIGDAANITLGLEATSWLLLAVFALLASVPGWITWAVAMHLLGVGAFDKRATGT